MVIEVARWAIAALFVLVLVLASVSDVRRRQIPNWTVVALIVLFLGWAFVGTPLSLISSLEAAAIVFVVTAALFAFGVLGAGDSKLMTVVALFAGLGQLPLFVFATVLFGGVLAVIGLVVHPTRTWVALYQMRGKGDLGNSVPYGVAISLAGVLVLARGLACSVSFCPKLIL